MHGVNADCAVRGLIRIAHDAAHASGRENAVRMLGRVAESFTEPDNPPAFRSIATALVDALADPDHIVRSAGADALEGWAHE